MRLYQGQIAGKNYLPDHFRILISGPSGTEKDYQIDCESLGSHYLVFLSIKVTIKKSKFNQNFYNL